MVAIKPPRLAPAPLREHDWAEPATHQDVLDASKVLADHVKAQRSRDNEQLEAGLASLKQTLEASRARERDLEGQIKGLAGRVAQLAREANGHEEQLRDAHARMEAALSRQGEILLKSLPSGQEDLAEVVGRFGKVIKEEGDRRLESLRGEQLRLLEGHRAELEQRQKSFASALAEKDRELGGLREALQEQKSFLTESLSDLRGELEEVRKAATDKDQLLGRLVGAITALRLEVPVGAFQLEVSQPPAVVQNVVNVPEQATPTVSVSPAVVNFSPPPPKLLEKWIEYDSDGRPCRTIEREVKE